ncbi:MAG TPA: molybdopterin-dependent oxidoreductase [Candidatus Dormibacteraeota bacterium]|jgi:NADH-quinone oxidoreductase subunit G
MAADALPPDGSDDGLVGISIDGRSIRVPKGTLVTDAATELGIHIPIYCSHPKMDPVAVCRMCLVHVEKMPKLQPACATYAAEGMVVDTQRADVTKTREGMLEFLLINHPLDCPVCDRGGECDLQDFAFRYGPPSSRFPITEKVHFNKAVVLSDKIELDQERCILCWRCTRYYDEITGEKELVLQERGAHTIVNTFDGGPLTSDFQGNLPEICPVGALTHRQYRFKARPWDLQRTKSVCPECSYGCNINVDTRDFEVRRFASRDNPKVDDMWLCDRGRYSAESWNNVDRIRRPAVRHDGTVRDVSISEAIAAGARALREVRDRSGPGSIAVLGSAQNTNEELWLLQRLARDVLGTQHIDHQLETFTDIGPHEHSLAIAEIEECAAVIVLGDEPEQQAPVLTLRLHKAATKRGVSVRRVDHSASAATIGELPADGVIGVIGDESHREGAARLCAKLAKSHQVRRLTITREVNGRGAKDVGALPNSGPGYTGVVAGGKSGREILEAAAEGDIKALVVMGGSLWADGVAGLLERVGASVDVLVVIDTRPGPLSRAATVLIPGHAYFEKAGTVTNVEGRVQRLRPALPPATQTPTETRILSALAAELGAAGWPGDPLHVHRELAAAIPAYGLAGNGGRANFLALVTA